MRRFSSSVNIKALINIPGWSDSSVCADRENPYFTWQKEYDLFCRLITTRCRKEPVSPVFTCLSGDGASIVNTVLTALRTLVCSSSQSPGWSHPIFTCLGCSTLPLHHHQIFNFYFEIISHLQNSCKNSTKNSHIPFTQILQVLTFSIFFIIIYIYIFIYLRIHLFIFFFLFMKDLGISCTYVPFFPKSYCKGIICWKLSTEEAPTQPLCVQNPCSFLRTSDTWTNARHQWQCLQFMLVKLYFLLLRWKYKQVYWYFLPCNGLSCP